MDFERIIRERTAVRKFKSQKLEQEKLDKILEAGRLAPTAKNNQPIKIYVVQSEEGLEKIDKATNYRYGAGTVLIICGNEKVSYHKGEHATYEIDSAIVATHIMLASTNIGIANVWVECFDENIVKKEFLIPSELTPVCLMPLGYKAEDCPVNPLHSQRKNIEELVEYK